MLSTVLKGLDRFFWGGGDSDEKAADQCAAQIGVVTGGDEDFYQLSS